MEVGTKLLQQMKDLEETISGTGVRFRFNTLSMRTAYPNDTVEYAQPVMDSLLEAGFFLDERKVSEWEIDMIYRHAELDEYHTVRVSYKPSAFDEMMELKKQQAKIEQRLAKLGGNTQKEGE